MILTLIRTSALSDRTLGELLVDGIHFCYTLEDTLRPDGVKIKGVTAIQSGMYYVENTMSRSFGRMMPLVKDTPLFRGVRLHGGNKPEHTNGCPLVAYKKTNDNRIYKSAETDLTALIKNNGGKCMLVVVDYLKELA